MSNTSLRLEARRESFRIAGSLGRVVDPRTIEKALLEGLDRVRALEVRELLREPVAAFRVARGLEHLPKVGGEPPQAA